MEKKKKRNKNPKKKKENRLRFAFRDIHNANDKLNRPSVF